MLPLISGAILTAKNASDALKASNLRAIKILVARTKPSNDVLVLIGESRCFLARFDDGCGALDVARGPMAGIFNLAVPERLHCPERHRRDLARHTRQPALAVAIEGSGNDRD